MDDHFVLPDFVHDQIVADRKSSKSRFARRFAHDGVSASRAAGCSMRATSRAAASRLSRAMYAKIFVEIGERTAFIPQFHALR